MGVGYRPGDDGSLLTARDHMLAGGTSSAATRATCQPLDVLKIRLQLQLESGPEAKYRSLPHAVTSILREEGVTALWKGHVPAQLLSITYGVVQFAAFESLTKAAFALDPRTSADGALGPPAHFVCGAAAGVCATLASYPFDVVRTRLVAQPGRETRSYLGTADAVRKMLAKEGPRVLFRGIVPTFTAIAPYSGLQFGFYNAFKHLLGLFEEDLEGSPKERFSLPSSMTCGALAGLCAKATVYPFDTTKKRMQVSGFGEGRLGMGRTGNYKGMVDCMATIIKSEGPRGLFKGLTASLIKAVATTSLHFAFYEYCIQALTLWRRKKKKEL